MKTRTFSPLTLLLPALLLCAPGAAFASARSSHVIGLYAEGSGDSVYSANVGVDTSDSLRLHAGTGLELSPLKAGGLNAGAMYFFMASDLSVFAGGTVSGIWGSVKTPGITTGGVSADGGVDWTTQVGFNLGVKVSIPLAALTDPGVVLYIGWYF